MTDLAIRKNDANGGLDVMTLGKLLAESGYFTDAKGMAQAVVKILYGQELGISPVAAMSGVHIIQGKPALSANLMASVIKRSGRYNYVIKQMDEQACVLDFFEQGKQLGTSIFSIEDADKAGLRADRSNTGKNMWKAYPRNMLFARALSNGARWYCPDLWGGAVYTPEELTGEITEVPDLIDAPLEEPEHYVQREPIPPPAEGIIEANRASQGLSQSTTRPTMNRQAPMPPQPRTAAQEPIIGAQRGAALSRQLDAAHLTAIEFDIVYMGIEGRPYHELTPSEVSGVQERLREVIAGRTQQELAF